MSVTWRVIVEDRAQDGTVNMARDRAIQLAHAGGDAPPTLRLYRWHRPTVTLGRFQQASDVDAEACVAGGVDVVRRFTGGRGVLHDDELTYSIVAGVRDGIPRGVAASYRMLSAVLVDAYRVLGIEAELTPRVRGTRGSAACYLHSTRADLSVGAAKLSGSAQVWHEGTVLQHGSFVRSRDLGLEARVFRLDAEKRSELRAATVTLEDLLGEAPPIERVVEAAIGGLERALGVAACPGVLGDDEVALERGLIGAVALPVQ